MTTSPASRWPPQNTGVARVLLHDLLALEGSGVQLAQRRAGVRELGERRSQRLRARGLTYAESRPYQVGDDARSIDWRVTARSARTHTKLFEEEREQPVWLCVDLRPTMHFGTRAAFKSVHAAHVAALLGWSAMAAGDRIGCLTWSPRGITALPPRRGRPALLAALGLLARAGLKAEDNVALVPTGRIRATASALLAAAGSRTQLYVLSDFLAFDEVAFTELSTLGRRHRLAMLQVIDPFEEAPPALNGAWAIDDGGQPVRYDARTMSGRADTPARLAERLAGIATRTGGHHCLARTTESPAAVAARLLGAAERSGNR